MQIFHPNLLYKLPCEWNRQLCMMWFLHVGDPMPCRRWQVREAQCASWPLNPVPLAFGSLPGYRHLHPVPPAALPPTDRPFTVVFVH